MSRIFTHSLAAIAAVVFAVSSIGAVPPAQASAPAAIATIELA